MSSLSVVITAHNSQDFIIDCLRSVSFADEIIVIDNESVDETVSLAKQHGAKIFHRPNQPANLNANKNYGFTKAHGDWILSLDPDERIEADLKQEIIDIVNNLPGNIEGYYIPRKNIIFDKWIQHGLWYPDYQLRLFRRGAGAFSAVHNHELLEVEGPTQNLTGHILHYNYQTISQYLQKIDTTYSINEVDVFLKQGNTISWHDAIRFPLQDFITNYFGREGYKDGLHGLVLAILQAFYMFIVFAKVWEKQGFKPQKITIGQTESELKSFRQQFKYWFTNVKLKHASPLQKIWLKLLSRF